MTLPELEDQITVMMGGQAAEESIHHGVISSRTELERIALELTNAERNPRPSPDRSAACFFLKQVPA
jgi:hypothetical protein